MFCPSIAGLKKLSFSATISPDRKKLQEAMFEVITSEASYLKSLNILIWHFAQSSRLIGEPPFTGGGVIGKRDHRILFSDVIAVRIFYYRTPNYWKCPTKNTFLLHQIINLKLLYHKRITQGLANVRIYIFILLFWHLNPFIWSM
jgi:hypothetical protein